MNNVYLLLGSNEGDRVGWLQKAVALLSENCGPVLQSSPVYETAAWGITDQPAFLNRVVLLQTAQTPAELLDQIQKIESTLGRQRDIKWGQRTLDIDILFYNNEVIELPGLIIPHPFLQERRFTLIPLAEIAPEFTHPKLNKTVKELLTECPDKLEVHKFSEH